MDSSPRLNSLMVPVELLKEILAYCTKNDLARTSMANSQLLEISRDSLYSKVFVWGDATLTPILPALRNPKIAQRLRHVLLDPNYGYEESSHLDEFLDIIASSSLVRLDLIAFNGLRFSPDGWKQLLLVRFTRCWSLQYLKISLAFFVDSDFTFVLQEKALSDLDISDPRLLLHCNAPSESSVQTPLPTLDTLRICAGPHWRKLLRFLDLSQMKRLGIWDFDQEMRDLANDWGGLVTASAPSLESLSLWLTPNIIDKDIPRYLQSTSGFLKLHTLTLFHAIHHGGPPILWMNVFLHITGAFHTCSPSLRHIRLYLSSSIDKYRYDDLLKDQGFAQIAREVRGLKRLEMIEFTFRSSTPPSSPNHNKKLGQLVEMFHPVRLFIQYGISWNLAWPFFADDRQEPEWTRILERWTR
ncbi:hypothetical protein DL96DRAFT_1610180 [Flagelloscypha sp. PMI_526]|nr:hypothetical protein DL96DRAFT_1610180 [Flagelloscypha sp. PMI_526]